MKYKAGDIVTIARNRTGHLYEIGQRVTIECIVGTNYYRVINGGDSNLIHESEIKDKSILSAKEFLLSQYLPTTSDEERELWYKTSEWAQAVVPIMEAFKQQ